MPQLQPLVIEMLLSHEINTLFYLPFSGSKVEMMNLIVTGEIKGNEVAEKFLRVNSSENLFQTEIEDIQPNRIVLMMKVKAQTLQSKDQFMEKMLKLLVKVLIPEEENQFPNSTIDTVIIGFADRITLGTCILYYIFFYDL